MFGTYPRWLAGDGMGSSLVLPSVDRVDVLRPVVRAEPDVRLMRRCSGGVIHADRSHAVVGQYDGDITAVGSSLGYHAAVVLLHRNDAVRNDPDVHRNGKRRVTAAQELLLQVDVVPRARRQIRQAPGDVSRVATIDHFTRVAERSPEAATVGADRQCVEPRVRAVPVGSVEEVHVEHTVIPDVPSCVIDLDLGVASRIGVRLVLRIEISRMAGNLPGLDIGFSVASTIVAELDVAATVLVAVATDGRCGIAHSRARSGDGCG